MVTYLKALTKLYRVHLATGVSQTGIHYRCYRCNPTTSNHSGRRGHDRMVVGYIQLPVQ